MSIGRNKINFKRRLYKLVGNEFTLIHRYQGKDCKVHLRHNSLKCGHNTFWIIPKTFYHNPTCPVCSGRLDNKFTIQKKINKHINSKFRVIKFLKKSKPLTLECPHGHKFKKAFITFMHYPICPICLLIQKSRDFDNQLKKSSDNDYVRVGKYKGKDVKTYIKHKKCGYIWHIRPVNILYGFKHNKFHNPCPYCNHNIKWTINTFKQKLFDSVGNEYILVSDFKGVHYRVKLKHSKCGHVFPVFVNNFLYGEHARCPYCKRKNEFLSSMKKRHLLSSYKLIKFVNKNNVKIKHLKCGHSFIISTMGLLSPIKDINNHCPKCQQFNHTLTTNDIRLRLNKEYHYEYLLVSDYTGMNKKIIVKHMVCGNTFPVRATYILNSHRSFGFCPKCSKELALKKHNQQYKNNFIKSLPKDFNLLKYKQDYKKFKNMKIKLFHKSCGHSFWTRPRNFTSRKHPCPICAASGGEKVIMLYLDMNHIKWNYAYLLNNDKDKRKRLHLDFLIKDRRPYINNKHYINGIGIEYDGIQHFTPKAFNPNKISFKKHLKKFKRLKRNDRYKNQYCKGHNIYLVRIPYNMPILQELTTKVHPLLIH